ncbi:MAG: helix-turn-helix transcriptional regulator [Treponema sp.]|nr:helix-turn-helix transcriptional regulator [Treponema sp.]
MNKKAVSTPKTPVLTKREQEIFDLLLKGISPKEIAYKLHISYSTVNYHRDNMYKKLNVSSIQELFSKYIKKQPAGSVKNPKIGSKSKSKVFALDKFSIIFSAAHPWGWQYRLDPDFIYYDDKLKEGDIYRFTCSFISNVDLLFLNLNFVDTTDGVNGRCAGLWNSLTENNFIISDIKANIECDCSVLITVFKTASIFSIYANRFIFMTNPEVKDQPTLTFTKFEIQKT